MRPWMAVLALFLLSIGSAAQAAVIYRLVETRAGPGGEREIRYDASLTVADFITTETTFAVSSLDVAVNVYPYAEQRFEPNSGLCAFSSFGPPCAAIILSFSGGLGIFNGPIGTFETVGTTRLTFGLFDYTLTVTETGAAVPAPGALALLATGLLALGLTARRRTG